MTYISFIWDYHLNLMSVATAPQCNIPNSHTKVKNVIKIHQIYVPIYLFIMSYYSSFKFKQSVCTTLSVVDQCP